MILPTWAFDQIYKSLQLMFIKEGYEETTLLKKKTLQG